MTLHAFFFLPHLSVTCIYIILLFATSFSLATSFFLSISEKCSYTRDCSCMFMNEKGRQMHTPKAASDFQNKLPWMGFELATCFLGTL